MPMTLLLRRAGEVSARLRPQDGAPHRRPSRCTRSTGSPPRTGAAPVAAERRAIGALGRRSPRWRSCCWRCGPVAMLTRPEGDGGWSAERRTRELEQRADGGGRRPASRRHRRAPSERARDGADAAHAPRPRCSAPPAAIAASPRPASSSRSPAPTSPRRAAASSRRTTATGRYAFATDPQTTRVTLPPGRARGHAARSSPIRDKDLGTAERHR